MEEKYATEKYATLEVQEPKPGWQTTEFWLTLISQVVPVLVLLGVLGSDEAEGVQSGSNEFIKTGFAFLYAAATAIMYIYNRAKVKTSITNLPSIDVETNITK